MWAKALSILYLRTCADRSWVSGIITSHFTISINSTRVWITQRWAHSSSSWSDSSSWAPATLASWSWFSCGPRRTGALCLVIHTTTLGGGVAAGGTSTECWTTWIWTWQSKLSLSNIDTYLCKIERVTHLYM